MTLAAISEVPQMEALTEVAEGVIVRPMLPIDRAIDEYLDDLAAQRYSAKTREDYGRYLRKFGDTVPPGWDVAKITDTQVRTFRRRYVSKADTTQGNVYSALNGFFSWLVDAGKVKRSPMERQKAPRRKRPEDRDVLTVPVEDVRKLLAYRSADWTELLAVGVVAGVGPRRKAASNLRLSDYDPGSQARPARLRFREKGGKTVWKPIDTELRGRIDAAIVAGAIWAEPFDYLIPPRSLPRRPGDRDDRIVWRAIADVAKKCGVKAHPHALRRAFAVYYLERNPQDIATLKDLLGHRSILTTQVYLRARDRDTAMERGMSGFSWDTMESFREAEKEGFEPSSEALPLPDKDSPHLRVGTQWN